MKAWRRLRAARGGGPPPARPVNHVWIHGLPLQACGSASRGSISASSRPSLIGFVVGTLSAIMGIGGGFIIVPAMIYLLRMPTNVVIGTSLVQIIGITALTTLLQATSNYAVDIVLAAILIAGGVVGAQFGVRAGGKLRGEQIRFLLALLVLAVALRLLWGLVVTPRRFLHPDSWGHDAALRSLSLLLASPRPALGDENLVSGRQPGPDPDHLQLYRQRHCGVRRCRRPAEPARAATSWWWCAGPTPTLTVRRRDRVAGVWINHDAANLNGMPAYYYLASSRPLRQIAPAATLARYGIGVASLQPDTVHAHHDVEPFRQAALRLMTDQGLYREAPAGVEFLSDTLFRAHVPVPAGVTRGPI